MKNRSGKLKKKKHHTVCVHIAYIKTKIMIFHRYENSLTLCFCKVVKGFYKMISSCQLKNNHNGFLVIFIDIHFSLQHLLLLVAINL